MKLNELKEKLIKENKEFREEYYKDDLAFGLSNLVSNLRAHENVDQNKLAKLIKTKQSGISRLEKGVSLPSLTFINKIAETLNYRIIIKFVSKKTGTTFDSDGNVSVNNYCRISLKNNNIYPQATNSSMFSTEYKSPYLHIENNSLVIS